MPKKKLEGDVSAKISAIINPAPEFGEDEDDFTKVQHLTGEEQHSDSGDELNLAQFRKINIELLDAEDNKYAGVRAARKDFEQEKAFDSESSEESDVDLDAASIASSDRIEYSDAGEFEEEEVSEDSDENENSESDQDDDESMDEDKEDFKEIGAKVASDIEKGNAIRNQFSIWDSLLECRIKFQKSLSMANKLPHPSKSEAFKEVGGEEYATAQSTCKASVNKVLDSLLEFQKVCLDVNTKHYEENIGKRSMEDDEITSSESDDKESDHESHSGYHKQKKRRKIGEISEELKDLHDKLLPFRNDTIQKWNDKTRVTQLGSKDFSAFEQSTLKQIEMVLADKNRLLKRTRTKRSSYHVLGEDDEGPASKVLKADESTEIFDDDDFYHQLLRELMERKTSDVSDPVQLSRQWIELQKARSKMKKHVDQKASKGRKLRYNVHQKLVNFMPPIDNTNWSDDARTELFSSLFGKKILS